MGTSTQRTSQEETQHKSMEADPLMLFLLHMFLNTFVNSMHGFLKTNQKFPKNYLAGSYFELFEVSLDIFEKSMADLPGIQHYVGQAKCRKFTLEAEKITVEIINLMKSSHNEMLDNVNQNAVSLQSVTTNPHEWIEYNRKKFFTSLREFAEIFSKKHNIPLVPTEFVSSFGGVFEVFIANFEKYSAFFFQEDAHIKFPNTVSLVMAEVECRIKEEQQRKNRADVAFFQMEKFPEIHKLPSKIAVDKQIFISLKDFLSSLCSRARMEEKEKIEISRLGKFDEYIARQLLEMLPISTYKASEFLDSMHAEICNLLKYTDGLSGKWGKLVEAGEVILLIPNALTLPTIPALSQGEILTTV